jgi:hypothetical protein
LLLLFSLTLFVSATLLFFVQPMIGKMLLPRLGGTPAVWNTCMVFFQAMLLVGYAYTHTLSTWQSRRRQLLVQSALLLLPLAVLPFMLGDRTPPTEANPVFWLLWVLLGMVGLPFFVVATSAPLLQKWFATTGHSAAKDPYFLYGASNLGSMLGLLLYPLLIERIWDLPEQAMIWTAGYGLLIGLVLACAVAVWRSPEPAAALAAVPADAVLPEPLPELAPPETAVTVSRRRGARLPTSLPTAAPPAGVDIPRDPDAITPWRRIRWVLLAAVPTSLMLGVTNFLTTDIAAVPFFWVLPLALYLLTFILVFARWPVVWTETPHTVVLYLQPCFLLFLVLRMVAHLPVPMWGEFTLHLSAFFLTALLCHGELAKDRPTARHLTEFYLWMSVGGVLGGMFNALFAPVFFRYGVIEYPLAMVVACLLRPYMTQDVSEASEFAAPRSLADFLKVPVDLFLFALGMTTYTPAPKGPGDRRSWLSSTAAEICLDLAVPVLFGGFALLMVWAGDYEKVRLGTFVMPRRYLMVLPVVLALAMALRPVRFGLSIAALFLVVMVWDRYWENRVFEDRGFFGIVRVRENVEKYRDENGDTQKKVRRTLIHGGINHGQQIVEPAALRREPITYFHPSNGVGELYHKLTWGNPPDPQASPAEYDQWMQKYREAKYQFYPADARLPAALAGLGATGSPWPLLVGMHSQPPYAVLGLGTGTLACHGQPFQHVDFYEIDPIIRRLSVPPSGDADDLVFYYVDDAVKRGANLSIIMGDGRLKIKDAPEKYYHAISLDAFSSDAIPVHLLTKEAVEEYLKHLADGGVLIFNSTNRYVRINPVLARIAEDLGLECLSCPDWTDERYPEKYGADWLVMRRKDKNLPGETYLNGGPSLLKRLDLDGRWEKVEPLDDRAWTDSYSNLLKVMKW